MFFKLNTSFVFSYSIQQTGNFVNFMQTITFERSEGIMFERIIASFFGYIGALVILKLGSNFVKYIKNAPNRKKRDK